MKLCIPCAGELTNPFGATLFENGQPVYTNAWGFHLGLDVATQVGDAVRAIRTGRVLWAAEAGSLGLCVVLGHSDRSRSVYCHLSRIHAQAGTRIRAGRQIGLSGNTGLSFGPHTHIEIWVDGTRDVGDPFALTRDDPTALPADPHAIWRGYWPTVGIHQPGYGL